MGRRSRYPTTVDSMEAEAIYNRWGNMGAAHRCPEWAQFEGFYDYIKSNGINVYTTRMTRIDRTKPYGPDNVVFRPVEQERAEASKKAYSKKMIESWDETVARVRKAFGLPPLVIGNGGTDDGT